MNHRPLGRTGFNVSDISFGAWAIGGGWGEQSESDSMTSLHRALELGINFFDTADVYGGGLSEKLIARLRRERSEPLPRRHQGGPRAQSAHGGGATTKKNLTAFVEGSLQRLDTDCLDLVQLHCPPVETYYQPETFAALDRLVAAGKIRNYGVSVEKVEEALKAIEYPGVSTVQIIFNMFRHRPAELFFAEAKRRNVGHHRPRSPRQRPAHRQVPARFRVRRRRSPQVQPARRAFRSRRNLLRRRLRYRARGRGPVADTRPPPRQRSPNGRCAGFSCSTLFPASFPAPALPRKSRTTPAHPICPR